MKALVYHGPGDKAWEDVARPTLDADTDAIVRVDTTTICGTDLHILKGDVPAVTDGRILGHEAVGTVVEVGAGVKNVTVGDRVLVSCITACGACRYCREGRYGQCLGGGGWILGHKIDGTQAEYVRVPFADTSTYPMPAGVSDEEHADARRHPAHRLRGRGAQRSRRPGRRRRRRRRRPDRPGRHHAAPGCTARPTSSPSTWPTAGSKRPSSSAPTSTINNDRAGPVAVVRGLTGGLGADVAIEAVGVPATFELRRRPGPPRRPRRQHRRARQAGDAAPRGAVDRNVTITTGLVDTYSTPTLLRLIASHQIDAAALRHPPLRLDDFLERLRRVRPRRRDRRPQGRPQPHR